MMPSAAHRPTFHGSLGFLILLALAIVLLHGELSAQAAQPAGSPQMRHFWHVFAAYALAWLLIFAWIVSILRRLRKVEDRIAGR